MRIAHIVDALDVGGKETFVVSMCRLQRDMEHTPSVHCLVKAGPLGEMLRREGFPVVVHGPASRLETMRRLGRALDQERPEVVHCHNVQATVFGAPVAHWRGIPAVISTRHNLVSAPYNWKREIQYSLACRFFCHRAVTVCESARANLSRMPFSKASKIVTIYNGAAPQPAKPIESPAPVKSGFTFVQISRLTPPKDPATLLTGFEKALRTMPDLRLWVVGDGTLAAEARALADSLGLGAAVTFFGQRGDVPAFLELADCFVLSSRSEGVPIAQLEAMAAGLPMIVTRVGGMPEVLPEVLPEGDGFLSTPVGDPEAMAEAMLRIARQAGRREEWAGIARRHYQQRFTLERMAAEYLELFQVSQSRAT